MNTCNCGWCVNCEKAVADATASAFAAKDARIAELEAALKPFADADWNILDDEADSVPAMALGRGKYVLVGDVRRASRVLNGGTNAG